MVTAVDALVDEVQRADGAYRWGSGVYVDLEDESTAELRLSEHPILHTEHDYAVWTVLFVVPGYVEKRLQQDKQMLMFPCW